MQIPAETSGRRKISVKPAGQALKGDQHVTSPQGRAGRALGFKEIGTSTVLLSFWLTSAGVCGHYLSWDSPCNCFSPSPHSEVTLKTLASPNIALTQPQSCGSSLHRHDNSDAITSPSRNLSFLYSEVPSCSCLSHPLPLALTSSVLRGSPTYFSLVPGCPSFPFHGSYRRAHVFLAQVRNSV